MLLNGINWLGMGVLHIVCLLLFPVKSNIGAHTDEYGIFCCVRCRKFTRRRKQKWSLKQRVLWWTPTEYGVLHVMKTDIFSFFMKQVITYKLSMSQFVVTHVSEASRSRLLLHNFCLQRLAELCVVLTFLLAFQLSHSGWFK